MTIPPSPTAAVGSVVPGVFSSASLYVGDLDVSVQEGDLYDVFSRIGTVVSIRVCRDIMKRMSLGYAYVNFSTHQEASRALEVLNFTPVKGKPIRIMFVNRDPSIRKSGVANVFVKNLDPSIDNKALHEVFASFGTPLSCKVASDGNGQSKGFGFVQFGNEEAAKQAIEQLNGMLINGKKAYVGIFVPRHQRTRLVGSQKFNNVYVKNLSETTRDEDLKEIFGQYGCITSAIVMKDSNGNSKCFGFVNFENYDDAANAVDKLNGSTSYGDKVWYVGRAQTRAERDAELKTKYEQERKVRFEKTKGANLYLKNLDDYIDDEKLKELFSDFGSITSCKVMIDSQGRSKGCGFVAFSTAEEATKAMNAMNSKIVGKKPLYVAIAQRKDDRRVELQARFGQISPQPEVVAPAIKSSFPTYSAAPTLAPAQIYISHGAHAIVPPQPAGYGFQQQLMPGIRPGIPPNYLMPYNFQRQVQSGQRMGFRRGGSFHQLQPNQQQRHNQGFRYMQGVRNGFDPSFLPQGIMGPTVPIHLDASGMPSSVDAGSFCSIPLASALAATTPENQREILGGHLFPLVERMEGVNAGKVTGMLLEMDQTEVLHLIESPEALKKKVAEAMQVLRKAHIAEADAADHFGSLSLEG